jgi:hypothetical protein
VLGAERRGHPSVGDQSVFTRLLNHVEGTSKNSFSVYLADKEYTFQLQVKPPGRRHVLSEALPVFMSAGTLLDFAPDQGRVKRWGFSLNATGICVVDHFVYAFTPQQHRTVRYELKDTPVDSKLMDSGSVVMVYVEEISTKMKIKRILTKMDLSLLVHGYIASTVARFGHNSETHTHYVCVSDSDVFVFDITRQQLVARIDLGTSSIRALVAESNAEGQFLYTLQPDNVVRQWKLTSEELLIRRALRTLLPDELISIIMEYTGAFEFSVMLVECSHFPGSNRQIVLRPTPLHVTLWAWITSTSSN